MPAIYKWVKAETPAARARTPDEPQGTGALAPSVEDLFRDHFQFVWRSARRLGVPPAQLDDVVQDVFLVVHRQLPSYEPRTGPRAWLFSITRRVAADHRRAVRRKRGPLPLHDAIASQDGRTPLRDAMNSERSDVILEFLASLDDKHRETFILCELEQLSAPEIADAVGASTPAVYWRIRTVRQAFVKYVRERYPELMGGADG